MYLWKYTVAIFGFIGMQILNEISDIFYVVLI
jgi:hypothetical protein